MASITTNKLISNAYKQIGIAADDRNLSGAQTQEGLDALNVLLDFFEKENFLIEYDKELSFNLIVGQDEYELSNEGTADVASNKISHLKDLNLIYGNIRYPLGVIDDYFKWDVRRQTNLSGRPKKVFLQNFNLGSKLVFDLLPDKTYQCDLKAKFALNNATLSTDFTVVSPNYISFLNMALARELSLYYPSATWSVKSEKIYIEKLNSIKAKSDSDLIQKTSVVLTRRNYSYNVLDW